MIRHRRQYYALVASLPALPRIREAERLPINEQRLESRLLMLAPDDAEVVKRLRKFIHWQNHPPGETDADIAAQYRELLEKNPNPVVHSAIAFRMNLRTVLAGLRHRLRGQTEPPPNHEWGAGYWVRHIEANWEHPDFRLAHIFPWVPIAREHLENGRTIQLEELAMDLTWDALDRSAFGKYFELETVIAFIFKWDLLRRWLSYREDAAREQFEAIAATLFQPDLSLAETPAP
jgi:hypothetical protein